MRYLAQSKLRSKTGTVLLRAAVACMLLAAVTTSLVLFAAAQSATPRLSQSQAGFYRMKVGDFEVTALSDGTVRLPVFD